MPTKSTYLVAFLSVTLVSAGMHYFVYRNLRQLLQRDFPERYEQLRTIARSLFILMDLPFVFLFFRRQIEMPLETLTKVLLYPFSIWQFLMIVWVAVLVPVTIAKQLHRFVRKRSSSTTAVSSSGTLFSSTSSSIPSTSFSSSHSS